jgi:hypothetical protein
MKNIFKTLGLVLFVASSAFSLNAANNLNSNDPGGRWEKLGSRNVNYSVDHDEISVTKSEGLFTALKLKITRSALNMHKMVIHFGDGTSQDVELKNNFHAGDESRVIDLPGNKRVISSVEFWYDTKNYKDKRAEIELWGRH